MDTDSLMVIGGQWGDEGKGKVVDLLSSGFAAVVRYNGGNNAGHTVRYADRHFALHLVPSGIIHDGVSCYLASGMVVDPTGLLGEMDKLVAEGIAIEGRLFLTARHADPADPPRPRQRPRRDPRLGQDRHHRSWHRPGVSGPRPAARPPRPRPDRRGAAARTRTQPDGAAQPRTHRPLRRRAGGSGTRRGGARGRSRAAGPAGGRGRTGVAPPPCRRTGRSVRRRPGSHARPRVGHLPLCDLVVLSARLRRGLVRHRTEDVGARDRDHEGLRHPRRQRPLPVRARKRAR